MSWKRVVEAGERWRSLRQHGRQRFCWKAAVSVEVEVWRGSPVGLGHQGGGGPQEQRPGVPSVGKDSKGQLADVGTTRGEKSGETTEETVPSGQAWGPGEAWSLPSSESGAMGMPGSG